MFSSDNDAIKVVPYVSFPVRTIVAPEVPSPSDLDRIGKGKFNRLKGGNSDPNSSCVGVDD